MCLRFNLGPRLTFTSRHRVTCTAEAGGDGKGKGRKTLSLSLPFLLSITPLAPLRRDKERLMGTSQGPRCKRCLSPLVRSAKRRRYPCSGPTTASANYRSVSNFRSTWLANGKWPFNRPVMARTQILVHWWGGPTVPRPRAESAKGSLHYRGSVLWNKIPSEIRKLPSLNVFKTSIHGKDFSNTPWPIVTLIIHNVSFCIFNIIVNSSLQYFSLVLNTIPKQTMWNDTISCINKDWWWWWWKRIWALFRRRT